METIARILQVDDCGTLLLQRSFAPYILGCLLPLDIIKRPYLAELRLESGIQIRNNQTCLELKVHMESGRSAHHYGFLLEATTHPEILDSLCQASALYLLTGHAHPVDPLSAVQSENPDTSNSLYQRVYQGGIAIEINESVREQIRLIKQICTARAQLRVQTSVM